MKHPINADRYLKHAVIGHTPAGEPVIIPYNSHVVITNPEVRFKKHRRKVEVQDDNANHATVSVKELRKRPR